MFAKKTVFVVGAGASAELDLPVGSQLKDIIAQKLDIRYTDGLRLTSGDYRIVDAIKNLTSNGQGQNAYYDAGRSIANAMPLSISIDNFLHTHNHDVHTILMGKLGIVQSILEAEAQSKIYNKRGDSQGFDLQNTKDVWLSTFCQMLCEGVELHNLDSIFENVAFIVFNYDRCLEHFLAHALTVYFKIQRSEAIKLVNKLTIIHPYGQVGRLPWQMDAEGGDVEYGDYELYTPKLLEIAKQIKTFTERIEDDAKMEQMRFLLSEAKVVTYLGFSYGEMNMKLMKSRSRKTPFVFGTAFGISQPNIKAVIKDIPQSIGYPAHQMRPELANLPCQDFLNQYWKPILRGMKLEDKPKAKWQSRHSLPPLFQGNYQFQT